MHPVRNDRAASAARLAQPHRPPPTGRQGDQAGLAQAAAGLRRGVRHLRGTDRIDRSGRGVVARCGTRGGGGLGDECAHRRDPQELRCRVEYRDARRHGCGRPVRGGPSAQVGIDETVMTTGRLTRRRQQIHGHRGHKDDPLFKLRRVLRVGQERLDDATVAKIFDRLRDADTDDEVASAWVAVDLLRRMYQHPIVTPPTAGWSPSTSAPPTSTCPRSPAWPAQSTPGRQRCWRTSTPVPPTPPPSPRT